MQAKPKQALSQEKRLVMTFQMQKALHLLQMSQMELKAFIQEELEKNPLLEEQETSSQSNTFEEIPHQESSYAKILRQIKENFSCKSDQYIGSILLEYLDEKGFLSTPLEEIQNTHLIPIEKLRSVLSILQTFHPPGIFAKNLQESLLLQLKEQGNTNTAAFHIAEHFFTDLIHGRYKKIQKETKIDHFKEAIDTLSKLRLRPIDNSLYEIAPHIVEDFTITEEDHHWDCSLNESFLPQIAIRTQYETLQLTSPEEKETLHHWVESAKWLLRSLKKRRQLLMKIVLYSLKHQIEYILGDGHLKPLSLQEAARHLNVHESTVSRAISHKYVKTPRGLLSIRSLFTIASSTKHAKHILAEIIAQEKKTKPFTDLDLALELKKRGIEISRRTVTKYRKELKIQATSLRNL